jgi:hypothetical protein
LKSGQTISFAPLGLKVYGNAPFSVSATASSGLAVTFTAAGNCSIAGNSVTITGAGSCALTALQNGDANYNPATPVTQSFTIAKAPQTITFAARANKTYGDPEFVVQATSSSGLLVGFTATGNCTVRSVVGSPPFSFVSFIVSLTGAGSCALTALQSGDANYNPAPSVTQAFTISPKPASVTPAAKSKTYGDGDPPLTGSLSGFLTADGVSAAYSRTSGENVVGSPYTISATLGPAGVLGNYAITYNTATFTIVKANQTISFAALSGKTFGDPRFNVLATATSGLPVSFSATGACSVSGTLVTITGGGTCTITANQPGNTNYNAAPSVTRSLFVACLPAQLPFAIRTPSGPVAVTTFVITSQSPTATANNCTGGFDLRIPFGTGSLTVASGTFSATTVGTIVTADLTGAFLFGGPAFTATIRIDVSTQTGSIRTTVPTEDGPITIVTTVARIGSAYLVTGVSTI